MCVILWQLFTFVFSIKYCIVTIMDKFQWYIFKTGDYPDHFSHYFCYWIAPFAAAIFASALYVIYAGGYLFGMTLPLGPVKGGAKKVSDSKKRS